MLCLQIHNDLFFRMFHWVEASRRAHVPDATDSEKATSSLLTFHDWAATLNASSSPPNTTANMLRRSLNTATSKHGARGVAPHWTWAGEGLRQQRKRKALQPLRGRALPSGRPLCARCSNCTGRARGSCLSALTGNDSLTSYWAQALGKTETTSLPAQNGSQRRVTVQGNKCSTFTVPTNNEIGVQRMTQ